MDTRDRLLAFNYAAAIFTSAFLLFQVQPLVSKHILPWFGGSAAVWTTCLLFFQTLLFFGYAYAHLIHARLGIRQQVTLHIGLIVAALLFGRVLAGPDWEPRGGEEPVSSILMILAISVGLPYFVLSATGPLLQAWFAHSFPGRSPYRLYALSNVGSLLALLSYPLYFERHFSVPRQAQYWLIGFLLYGVLCAYAAWRLWNSDRPIVGQTSVRQSKKDGVKSVPRPLVRTSDSLADSPALPAPNILQRILWVLWPMFASIVLMATTNHVSTDIAVMPFLWIVPLALYLLTFIIAFDRPGWYFRMPFAGLVLASLYITALVHSLGTGRHDLFDAGTPGSLLSSIVLIVKPTFQSPQIHIGTMAFLGVNFATMFFICMLCHDELFRQRPDPKYLTSYYLMIALGGALGGVFVTFIAPQLFATYYEWELSLFIACLLALGFLLYGMVEIVFRDDNQRARRPWHYALLGALVLAIFLPSSFLLLDLVDFLQPTGGDAKHRFRNFYGALAVYERNEEDPQLHNFLVKHGTITHGIQFTHENRRREPLSYYGRKSGVGRAIDYFRGKLGNKPLRIGVVGLGAGTMAAYAERGDSVTFYEINADVVQLTESGRWFTYLKDCRQRGAQCDVRLGDARLTMQREIEQRSGLNAVGIGQNYHIIVLDAFSGDSVPAHLLTVEAFELYLNHLTLGGLAAANADQGAILVHISNRYLNLAPLVFGIAEHLGCGAVHIGNELDEKNKVYRSDWIIVTRNNTLIQDLAQYATDVVRHPTVIWTDTHSSLFDLLK
jgi:hypothetical protein